MTGHRQLTAGITTHLRAKIVAVLGEQPRPLVGVTSLADGADQLFAASVLEQGGAVHVVLPAAGYEATVRDSESYGRLLAAAAEVTVLDFAEPGPDAYSAAGRYIADHCDLLVAIWDGEAPRGPGGTHAAVTYALRIGRPVRVCWPAEAVRP
ncbi:hypothetical protein [Amycolatopsis coloradensis]|uniref:hypothetical protein n=1 Tax=Amycolatopsis coloradensis TaxID=76021 RepID=UPI001FCA43A6|nr:hypothetical protein [Amycolatopsis coloradensis]